VMDRRGILLLLGVVCFYAVDARSPLRLIEFNETTRMWLSPEKVEKLAEECGFGHGGYMDVTDHRTMSAEDLTSSVKQRLATIAYPPEPTHQKIVQDLISLLSRDQMVAYNNKLSSYATRYYTTVTGKESAEWIKSEFERNTNGRNDISVKLFPHSWLQSSVIARIEGEGDYADEVVIVGAHEDSTSNGKTAPGADDDASGTATVLELFRVWAFSGLRPSRSIEFHTYAAEEAGLLGSQAIAASYQKQGVFVYGQMQLDMTFYTKPGVTPVYGIITDFVDPSLTEFLRKLVFAYSLLDSADSKCGYGCSDHASWNKAGYPACFPFEATFNTRNPYIHTVNDVFSHLNINHGVEFAKVALGYLAELSLVD